MTTVNNNRAPIAATEASFEDQLAIALAASKEEATAAPAPAATNESQQKALEAAHDAAQRQKEVLKASEPEAPAPASASASSSSAAAATSSSSTEDKDLEAAIKASLEPAAAAPKADAFPPLTPTTNEAWVDKEITGIAKIAIKIARPFLLALYSAKITPAAKEIIKNLDIDKLNTLGDVEKAMIPLINMCEPNEALRASSHIDAKKCFQLYADKGVAAAIAYAKNPT